MKAARDTAQGRALRLEGDLDAARDQIAGLEQSNDCLLADNLQQSSLINSIRLRERERAHQLETVKEQVAKLQKEKDTGLERVRELEHRLTDQLSQRAKLHDACLLSRFIKQHVETPFGIEEAVLDQVIGAFVLGDPSLIPRHTMVQVMAPPTGWDGIARIQLPHGVSAIQSTAIPVAGLAAAATATKASPPVADLAAAATTTKASPPVPRPASTEVTLHETIAIDDDETESSPSPRTKPAPRTTPPRSAKGKRPARTVQTKRSGLSLKRFEKMEKDRQKKLEAADRARKVPMKEAVEQARKAAITSSKAGLGKRAAPKAAGQVAKRAKTGPSGSPVDTTNDEAIARRLQADFNAEDDEDSALDSDFEEPDVDGREPESDDGSEDSDSDTVIDADTGSESTGFEKIGYRDTGKRQVPVADKGDESLDKEEVLRRAILALPNHAGPGADRHGFIEGKHDLEFDLSTTGLDTTLLETGTKCHRATWHGVAMQGITTRQTEGFPDYQVLKRDSAEAAAKYGKERGWEHIDRLHEAVPWNRVWSRRVRGLFLVDPGLLSAEEVEWIKLCLRFQFEYRQAIFQIKHWLHMSRKPEDPRWKTRYLSRQNLDGAYSDACVMIERLRPTTLTEAMRRRLAHEPALWIRPISPCIWVPDFDALTDPKHPIPLHAQLDELWEEEPVRCEWGPYVDRFPELLAPEHVQALEDHPTTTWELPKPWNDPSHLPGLLTRVTLGSPGPDFYAHRLPEDLKGRWKRARTALQQAVIRGTRDPEVLFPNLEED